MSVFRRMRPKVAACLFCALFLAAAAALAVLAGAVWPMEGEERKQDGKLTVDVSNASQGYILAKSDKTSSKLKLRISLEEMTYTYDLEGNGEYVVFPLQMGSGKYGISLYRNVKSNKYSKDGGVSLKVELEDENAAFLCPSQYVDYTQETPAVAMAAQLCEGLETDAEKLQAIRDFMVTGFAYDYERARSEPPGYLGDIEGCFETRMGLCQDLAAVTACMLRSQGIPTQLVIGYAGKQYHAWNNVFIDGEFRHLDVTGDMSGFPSDTVYAAERVY